MLRACMLAGLMVVATPALSQGLNRSADLVSPQSGRADPGDLVMDINVTEALPNAFGGADLFGRLIFIDRGAPLRNTLPTLSAADFALEAATSVGPAYRWPCDREHFAHILGERLAKALGIGRHWAPLVH